MTEYYQNAKEAIPEYFEPKTPCRLMETRACVDITLDESRHYRVEECPPNLCNRFEAEHDIDALLEKELGHGKTSTAD